MKRLVLAIIIWAACSISWPVMAGIDAVQYHLLASHDLALRWDNVENAPEWISGKKPGYDMGEGMHVIRFAPGERTFLWIPSQQMLRIKFFQDQPFLEALEISVSDGSGLFWYPEIRKDPESRNLLVSCDADYPMIACLKWPETAPEEIRLAAFVSRREPLENLAPHREIIPLPVPETTLTEGRLPDRQRFWKLMPNEPVILEVEGPAGLALENRLVYPGTETERGITYRVYVKIDNVRLEVLEFVTRPEMKYPVFESRIARVTGLKETGYLHIPEGRHNLELTSTAQLYGRLLVRDDPDYLFSGLNAPDPDAGEIIKRGLDGILNISPWAIEESRIAGADEPGRYSPAGIERVALALVRDNRRKDGGLLGAMLLKQAGQRNPEYPLIREHAGELMGNHTFYRDLLPSNKVSIAPFKNMRFIPKRLRDLGEPRGPVVAARQHMDTLLKSISEAVFVEILPEKSADAAIFCPPARPGPSILRIITDLATSCGQEFMIQMDGRSPIRFRVENTPAFPSEAYQVPMGEAGLAMLEMTHPKFHVSTLGGPFAATASPAVLASAGIIEIPLPRDVEQIKVWKSFPPYPGYEKLFLAFQYRAAKPYGLSESQYFNILDRVRDRENFPSRLLESLQAAVGPVPLRIKTGAKPFETSHDGSETAHAFQVGVYAEVENVTDMEEKLDRLGLSWFKQTMTGRDNRPLTVVLAGPYSDIAGANEARSRLERARMKFYPKRIDNSAMPEFQRMPPSGEHMDGRALRTDAENSDPENTYAIREIANHWEPLVRFLTSRLMVFSEGLDRPEVLPESSTLKEKDIKRLQNLALRLEEAEQWLPALEIYGQLYHGAMGDVRREAMMARVRVLENLGENFMAERIKKGLFLFGETEEIRQFGLYQLDRSYRVIEDWESLIAIHAIAALRAGKPSEMKTLVELLDKAQYPEMALMLGLALEREDRPRDILIRSAFLLQWRRVFETLLMDEVDLEKKALWMGHLYCSNGEYEKAMDQYLRTGESGREWSEALAAGIAIFERLADLDPTDSDIMKDPEDIRKAVSDWGRWRARHPGPFRWSDASGRITDCAGTRVLYSPARDLYGTVFRSEPGRPVKMLFTGESELRIDVRPLHPKNATEPLDGWLFIKGGGQVKRIPITRNQTVETVSIIGDDQWEPGNNVTAFFSLSEGVNEIEINGGSDALLVKVSIREPAIPIPVLGPLTPETLNAFLNGEFCRTPQKRTLQTKENPLKARVIPVLDYLMILPKDYEKLPEKFDLETVSTTPSSRGPLGQDQISRIFPAAWETAGDSDTDFSATGEDDLAAIENMSRISSPEEVMARMGQLVWLAEHSPENLKKWLVLGERLFFEFRHAPIDGLQTLHNRLAILGGWEGVSSIQASAGIRYEPMAQWSPESPDIRVRKALLPPIASDAHVIFDDKPWVMTFENVRPVNLETRLSLVEPPFLPSGSMTVWFQLDDAPVKNVVLSDLAPTQLLSSRIRAREHVLRIGIHQKAQNQFLVIEVQEFGRQENEGNTEDLDETQIGQRAYHVATAEEPLGFMIQGPGWVRIDELHDGLTLSEYKAISDEGWQTVEIGPSGGRNESLYRVFEWNVGDGALREFPLEIVTREKTRPAPPVPGPIFSLADKKSDGSLRFQDRFSPGGQEDGTWSLSASWNRRKNVQEDISQLKNPEEFFELNLAHRFYDEYRRTYFLSEATGRIRRNGGPVLGLEETLYHSPRDLPFNVRLSAQAWLQRPEAFDQGDLEGSLRLSGTMLQRRDLGLKTYHVPSFGLFGRYLTLDKGHGYDADILDQDVFTPYKADHKFGFRIGDTITHRPWMDTIWYGSAGLTSNENFNPFDPDYISATAGWEQLMGDFLLNAEYRFFHYFSDDDRSKSADKDRIVLGLLWDWWFFKLHRLELGLELTHELTSGETAGKIFVTSHFSDGRTFRDFRPGEIEFRDIRERLIPLNENNSIKDAE